MVALESEHVRGGKKGNVGWVEAPDPVTALDLAVLGACCAEGSQLGQCHVPLWLVAGRLFWPQGRLIPD